MESTQTLYTDRLLVNIHTAEAYIEAFHKLSDQALMERFGFENTPTLQAQKEKVLGGLITYRTNIQIYQLVERSSHNTVGNLSYHNWYPLHRRAEIGYMISAEGYKNKGFMKEALAVLIPYGFETLHLNRIEALIHPENIPSRKLVEHFQFKQEGLLKEHYCNEGLLEDSILYALLRREYMSNNSKQATNK